MGKNDNKRCPQCGGAIDYFGSCRRCGREWTENLEEDEVPEGLPEGQQHPSEVKPPASKRPKRNRFTKSSKGPKATSAADKYSLWRIDPANDDDTEIIRKRSLMRLDSRKTYNAMGLSLRAHEAEKAALLWLSRLWAFLSDEEQAALTPAVEHLKHSFADVKLVAQAKVNEAARMEIELEKEHKAARTARIRLQKVKAAAGINPALQSGKAKEIMPGEDTEGMGVPDLAVIDPKALEQLSYDDLLELAKAKLSNLDQEKALRRKSEKLATDDTPEE
jgi:hypothetical protein